MPTPTQAPFSPVLCYHQVRPRGESRSVYSVAPEQFAAQLRVAAGAAITFDDGDESVLRNGLPALAAAGRQATVFVTAGWIGTRRGTLDWVQLAEVARRGHAVGAHGWSHAVLTRVDERRLRDELIRPRRVLEDRLGCAVRALALPAGRGNERVWAACAAAGYAAVYTSDPFEARRWPGLEIRGRFALRRRTTEAMLARLLAGDAAAIAALRRRRAWQARLRRALGDGLYHAVWQARFGHGERIRTPAAPRAAPRQ